MGACYRVTILLAIKPLRVTPARDPCDLYHSCYPLTCILGLLGQALIERDIYAAHDPWEDSRMHSLGYS